MLMKNGWSFFRPPMVYTNAFHQLWPFGFPQLHWPSVLRDHLSRTAGLFTEGLPMEVGTKVGGNSKCPNPRKVERWLVHQLFWRNVHLVIFKLKCMWLTFSIYIYIIRVFWTSFETHPPTTKLWICLLEEGLRQQLAENLNIKELLCGHQWK